MGALLLTGVLAAQTPLPEWQAGLDKMKTLIKTSPEQALDEADVLLKVTSPK